LKKIKFLMGDDREGIPDCNLPNMMGSCGSGMTKDTKDPINKKL